MKSPASMRSSNLTSRSISSDERTTLGLDSSLPAVSMACVYMRGLSCRRSTHRNSERSSTPRARLSLDLGRIEWQARIGFDLAKDDAGAHVRDAGQLEQRLV